MATALEVLDQTNLAIKRGVLDADATEYVVEIVSNINVAKDLRHQGFNIVVVHGDDSQISSVVNACSPSFIEADQAFNAAIRVRDEWQRSELLLNVLDIYRSSKLIAGILDETEGFSDETVKQNTLTRIFSICSKSTEKIKPTRIDLSNKNRILKIAFHINDPFCRASTLARILLFYTEKQQIAQACVSSALEVRSHKQLSMLMHDIDTYLFEYRDRYYVDLRGRLEDLRRVEAPSSDAMPTRAENRFREAKGILRADIVSGKLDRWESFIQSVKDEISGKRLSPLDFVALKEHAATHNWSNRRARNYSWKCSPIDFISKEYKPWVDKGMTRAELRSADPDVSRRLDKWVKNGNRLPVGFLGIKEEVEAGSPLAIRREKEKLRKRAHRAKKRKARQKSVMSPPSP